MADRSTTPDEEGEILSEFRKNSRETVRVRKVRYNGLDLVDVRAWYPDGDGMKPGKGLSLRLEQLPELRKALMAAERALKAGSQTDEPKE